MCSLGKRVYRKVSQVQILFSPPEGNNTNTSDELEFVLFFFNDYFGLKVIRYKNKKINIKTDSRAMVRSAVS